MSLPAEGCRRRLCVPKGSAGLRPVHSRRGDSTPAAIHAYGSTRVHAGVRPTATNLVTLKQNPRYFGLVPCPTRECSFHPRRAGLVFTYTRRRAAECTASKQRHNGTRESHEGLAQRAVAHPSRCAALESSQAAGRPSALTRSGWSGRRKGRRRSHWSQESAQGSSSFAPWLVRVRQCRQWILYLV